MTTAEKDPAEIKLNAIKLKRERDLFFFFAICTIFLCIVMAANWPSRCEQMSQTHQAKNRATNR